jgi:RNA polymerase primary sigma factor
MADNALQFMSGHMSHRLLSREEEVILAKGIESGDHRARNRMIECNMRLALSIAKKFQASGCDLDDLIQESSIGLMKAVDKFDWRRGFKFSTYATWWIRQAVMRHVNHSKGLIRVPTHALSLLQRINRERQSYWDEFHEMPSIQELSTLLGVSENLVKLSLDAANVNVHVSIDDSHTSRGGDSSSSRTLAEVLTDEEAVSVEDLLGEEQLVEAVKRALSRLTPREEKIMRLRFGIAEISADERKRLVQDGFLPVEPSSEDEVTDANA